MKKLTYIFGLFVLIPLLGSAQTRITVTPAVVRSATEFEPLGLNNFGDIGGMSASSGNIIRQGGFELAHMRDLYRVIESGKDKGYQWITLDGPSTSNWLKYNTGAYSGARMRAYRFLDAGGASLPYKEAKVDGGRILDIKNVAQVRPLLTERCCRKTPPDSRTAAGWPIRVWPISTIGRPSRNRSRRKSKKGGESIMMRMCRCRWTTLLFLNKRFFGRIRTIFIRE